MIDRDPARALIQRTAAIVAAAALPAPAAPRYDGYAFFAVAYAMSWHFGSLPARALARRGVFIDVLHRDQAADRERLQVPPGSPILVDYEIAGTLDCAELRRSGTRVIIAIDDDLPHAPPWVRTVTGQPGAPVMREFVKALEPKLRAARRWPRLPDGASRGVARRIRRAGPRDPARRAPARRTAAAGRAAATATSTDATPPPLGG